MKSEKKFEDTGAFKLWSFIGVFGQFSTLYGDTPTKSKFMVITHPNLVVIVWNLFLSFLLSATLMGLFLTIPAWRTFKKHNAKIPLAVYSISIGLALLLWIWMGVSSDCWATDPITGKCSV